MTKNFRTIFSILVILMLCITFFRIRLQENNLAGCPQAEGSFFLMNTIVQIRIYGDKAEELLDRCFELLQDIENRMSKTIEGSDIYRINNSQGEFVSVSNDTIQVIRKALEYAEITEGRFDPSVGVLVDLWGIGTEQARVPSSEEIKVARGRVNYRWIEIDEEGSKVRLLKEGMKLDLGAIVKGYAADEIRKLLKAEGIRSAYINLGGNVLVMGGKPDNTPWKIGIQDPRRDMPGAIASFEVKDKTIVTSGNYERYFEKDGILYHHIIDPATGYPADSGIISASIITDDSIDADALSTSLFLLGIDKGLQLIDKLDGVEAVVVKDDLGIIMTEGLQDKLILLNDDFYIVTRK
ncbi:MAG: FAD:protein FMN transferase [Halanaerobiaceae bacterium]|jgi:thiamine biosynthesis lipoprotein|nr:FAD:protein FMN transferase [Halanaerobiaceae bacterium]